VSTLTQIADEVLLNLTSYGMVQPKLAQVSGALDASTTTVTVSSVIGIAASTMVEVGTELMYVLNVDPTNKQLTVVRGHLSTTAAGHADGSLLNANPLWPRQMVFNAINDAIIGSYPMLWAIDQVTLTPSPVVRSYTMDSSVADVYEVAIQDPVTLEWQVMSKWRFDNNRKKLFIQAWLNPVFPLQVTFFKRPIALSPTDDLTLSGLQASAKKYVVAQVSADLVSRMDNQRLQVNYASADDMDPNRPFGVAAKVTQTLQALANLELQNERKRLTASYPPVIHTARGRF